MTTWSAAKVAGWAQKAGWYGDEIPEATSYAMATSQGADHYSWCPSLSPSSEHRGLWGIRLDSVSDDEAASLYDPLANAGVAFSQWVANGRTWGWHPAHWSGEALRLRPVIVLALNSPRRTIVNGESGTFTDRLNRLLQLNNYVRSIGSPGSV
jgi:Lysozyme like domain